MMRPSSLAPARHYDWWIPNIGCSSLWMKLPWVLEKMFWHVVCEKAASWLVGQLWFVRKLSSEPHISSTVLPTQLSLSLTSLPHLSSFSSHTLFSLKILNVAGFRRCWEVVPHPRLRQHGRHQGAVPPRDFHQAGAVPHLRLLLVALAAAQALPSYERSLVVPIR